MKRFLILLSIFCTSAAYAAELRIATVQFESVDGEFSTNLDEVTKYVLLANEQDAKIVLLPEFSLIGYTLSADIWALAEPAGGPTEKALATLALQTGMYIGTSFLEVDGEDFYNTFILIAPNGGVAGQVRKQVPAGAEGYFFRGQTNHHVIDTPLGNIGIGICQENYRCFLPQQLYAGGADIVLMPFSYPDLSQAGGLGSPEGSYIASWYANQLGIPVVTSNKTGNWPQVAGAFFPGLSAAVNGDGEVLGVLNDLPGVLVVDVSLDSTIKKEPIAECIGPFLKGLTLGSWVEKRVTWATIWIAGLFDANPEDEIQTAYQSNPNRRAAALRFHQPTTDTTPASQ